jgi:hypothetical protein
MWPICPDVATETSMSAKYIASYLAPFVERIPTYVPNGHPVLRKIADLRNIPDAAVWLVADIDSLYPNIPVDDAYTAVRDLLHGPNFCNSLQIRDLVLELLRVQLHNNYFEFEGEYFLQIRGVPMGKAWAPAVACLYMSQWDSILVGRLHVKPILFVRYIDDLLLLFPSKEAADVALTVMNDIHTSIRVGEYTISNCVHFLDLLIELVSYSPTLGLKLDFVPNGGELVNRISLY